MEDLKLFSGKIKDENSGHQVIKFASLSSKTYSKVLEIDENLITRCKAKGVDKYKAKELTMDDYTRVLSTKEALIQTLNRIEIKLGSVKTISMKKTSLNYGDDKRYWIKNSFNTLAFGHYLIEEYENENVENDESD